MLKRYRKDPDDSRPFSLDFEEQLGSATISSVLWSTGGLTLEAQSNTTTVASATLSGGSNKSSYRVTARVTDSDGNIHDGEMLIYVCEGNPSGTYASLDDVVNRFGAENIATWSNTENNDRELDYGRIVAALDYADNHINDRFRDSRYETPLSPISTTIKNWAVTLAGVWLYESRGADELQEGARVHSLQFFRSMVEAEIDQALQGVINIGAMADSDRRAPFVCGD